MPRFLPSFPVEQVAMTPFERYLVGAYGVEAAREIFGLQEVERLWLRAFPGSFASLKDRVSVGKLVLERSEGVLAGGVRYVSRG
jgi:hypothetical protein